MIRRLAALALLTALGAARAEDIVILPAREGVTQSYLLSSPAAGKARAVAILFAGGAGKVELERESARTLLDRGNSAERQLRIFNANRDIVEVARAIADATESLPADAGASAG